MIQNLLKKNNYLISYPAADENGDIEFGGLHFRMQTVKIKTFTAPEAVTGTYADEN